MTATPPFIVSRYQQSPWPQRQVSQAAAPNVSLDLVDTDSGFLPNRLTTAQRNGISNPPTGLLIFNITVGQYEFYTGSAWTQLESGGGPTIQSVSITLSPEDIGASLNNPIMLIEAPGAGAAIVPMPPTYGTYDFQTTAYAIDCGIFWGNQNGLQFAIGNYILTSTQSALTDFYSQMTGALMGTSGAALYSQIDNQPLVFETSTLDTLGDSSLSLVLYYTVVELPGG
jgi:hypothetical protein